MKTFLYILLSLFLLSCGSDDNQMDELPPLTNTGENTFGCFIDGIPFIPQGIGLGGQERGAILQFIQINGDSFYNFYVYGLRIQDSTGVTINLRLPELEDFQSGETYQLGDWSGEDGLGTYIFDELTHDTNNQNTGILTITHFDYDNQIISGTFLFEVEVDGEIVKITEGRFDMEFTI